MSGSGLESFDPLRIKPVGELMQGRQMSGGVIQHLCRRLDAVRQWRDAIDFGWPGLAPCADQRLGHLDVALHAKMWAQRKHLVLAVRVVQQAFGTGRKLEGFAVPLEYRGLIHGAEPASCARRLLGGDAAPADFLDRIAFHLCAESLA